MWIRVRRVTRHWRVVEVIPAFNDGATTCRDEVHEVVVLISVVPRVTRLGCLLHPSRLIPVHVAYLHAKSGLIKRSKQLANLIRLPRSPSLISPCSNRKRIACISSYYCRLPVRWTAQTV